MNIFRPKYRFVKEKLRAFGEQVKGIDPKARYTAAFWRERLQGIADIKSWEYIITLYLAEWCTDNEREFIAVLFFSNYSAVRICNRFYISETVYYCRREQILNDIIGLALNVGIINITHTVETAATSEYISDNKWFEIEKLVADSIKRKPNNLRNCVMAILYVTEHNMRWREVPPEYGQWNAIYKRYVRWVKSGLWDKIVEIIES